MHIQKNSNEIVNWSISLRYAHIFEGRSIDRSLRVLLNIWKFDTKVKSSSFSPKHVKFKKYQLKLSNLEIYLYKRLKLCQVDSPEYDVYKHNSKMYQGYLNQWIQTTEKECYGKEFTNYEIDIRKTWYILRSIICKNKVKSKYFINIGQQILEIECCRQIQWISYTTRIEFGKFIWYHQQGNYWKLS